VTFAFAAGHRAFEGHFPGRPIVPAVALLAEVLAEAEAQTALPPTAWVLANAKFLSPALPDMALAIAFTDGTDGARRFEVTSAAGVVATGLLTRAPA
jgi:3-hydroxymyristoyl/3-hydroxydecanoyl-(acyl carrier protein) dehydratase